jgi:hypothetical protein
MVDQNANAPTEFFCQHPRWAQTRRYDKGVHRAPCSVYMHHSRSKKLTFYMIAASPDEDWFSSVLGRIGVLDGQVGASGDVLQALAHSPFLLHAIISTIAFEQSIQYVADVRERLMTQVAPPPSTQHVFASSPNRFPPDPPSERLLGRERRRPPKRPSARDD